MGNLSDRITKVADKYLNGVDVDFSISNICGVAKLGDYLDEISGEARISERHIRNIALSLREHLITGLRCRRSKAPDLVDQVIDYHIRGVIPVYRGGAPRPHGSVGSRINPNRVWRSWRNFGRMCALGEAWSVPQNRLVNTSKWFALHPPW